MDDWERALERHREQKDEFFAKHPKSTLSDAEKDDFDGLSYYDPDSSYRFVLPLDRADDPETVRVPTTEGGSQVYERCGSFVFSIDGAERHLWAYRNDDDERLWVPFRDATNGQTTYEGGRYIDLTADEWRDGDWIVDFNAAYTPFCAHTDSYECPLVPEANTLDVAIEAGERYERA